MHATTSIYMIPSVALRKYMASFSKKSNFWLIEDKFLNSNFREYRLVLFCMNIGFSKKFLDSWSVGPSVSPVWFMYLSTAHLVIHLIRFQKKKLLTFVATESFSVCSSILNNPRPDFHRKKENENKSMPNLHPSPGRSSGPLNTQPR